MNAYIIMAAEAAQDGHGWLSIMPPLVAIVLAAVTRRVVPSLLAGVFVGALIAAAWNPLIAVYQTIETHIWGSLSDGLSLRVIAFTLMMGAMVGVISANGSMAAFVRRLTPLARGRRGGQLVTWLLGLLVFFDDYANTVILGNTMRPVTDRLRISREKLAYLIDSTAAPVAGLALVSTWIATELKFIGDGMTEAHMVGSPRDVFIASIPFRLYVIWALLLVPLVACMGRDFGRMLRAERRAAESSPTAARKGADDGTFFRGAKDDVSGSARRTYALGAIVPVLTVVGVFCAILFGRGVDAEDVSYIALFYGALAGLAMSIILTLLARQLPVRAINDAIIAGGRTMVPALFVLVLAWALSGVTKDLGCADYIGGLLKNEEGGSAVAAQWLPAVVFIAAAAVAFATGSSWATMGILVPMVIPITATAIGDAASAEHPVLLAAVGSVLAGAVFGDHCSPISDTTVLSSQAAGCDHLAHVETQLPYALLAGAAALLGLIAIGLGVSPWLVLPLGMAAIAAALYVLGRSPEGA